MSARRPPSKRAAWRAAHPNPANPLAPFSALLADLSRAVAALGEAACSGDLARFRSGVRDLRYACIAIEAAMQKAVRT